MAVVLKGEQQSDGSFVFQASSEQVSGLNKMCDGNLNTQLSEVQFGMINTGELPPTYDTVPEYFYFDSPQLTVQNIVAPDGKLYNIIAKAMNNTQSGQFFIMTTTEPLRMLTLQSIADTPIVLRILNEDFIDYSRMFSDVQMIITAQKVPYNQYYKDSRKSLYTNVINTHTAESQ